MRPGAVILRRQDSSELQSASDCGLRIVRFSASWIGGILRARAATSAHARFEQRVESRRRRRRRSGRTAAPARARVLRAARSAARRSPRRSCWRRRAAALPPVRVEQRQLAAQHVEVRRPARGPRGPRRRPGAISTFVRSRCFRNRSPRPCPSCAPSIRPGTSATTKLRSSLMLHDAEIRRERRERVVGDLRLRRRDARDQRGLAGVGKPTRPDVGEQLQLQPQTRSPRRAGPAATCAARGWWRWRSARCRARPCRPARPARAGPARRGRQRAQSGQRSALGASRGPCVSHRPARPCVDASRAPRRRVDRPSRTPACRSAPRARDPCPCARALRALPVLAALGLDARDGTGSGRAC